MGYLGDVLILPALAVLAIRCIPKEAWERSQATAEGLWEDGKPKRWYCAILIVAFWLLIVWLIVKAVWL